MGNKTRIAKSCDLLELEIPEWMEHSAVIHEAVTVCIKHNLPVQFVERGKKYKISPDDVVRAYLYAEKEIQLELTFSENTQPTAGLVLQTPLLAPS